MSNFLNTCRFVAGSSGTGSFLDGVGETGFRNLTDAGATPGFTYSYRAESADRTQWENGIGTYIGSPAALARTTVLESSNANAAVNFSAPPVVMITAFRLDIGSGVRVHSAAGAATIRASDRVLIIKKTVGAATNVNFPSVAQRLADGGFPVVIKDGKGDADSNNITPVFNGAETADGLTGADFAISNKYGWRKFVPNPDSSEWNEIS